MESAIIAGAIAKESHTHTVGAFQLEFISRAAGQQDAGADNARCAIKTHFRLKQVHAPAAASAAAGGFAHDFGDQPFWFHPFREGMTMPAMGAEYSIADAKVGT